MSMLVASTNVPRARRIPTFLPIIWKSGSRSACSSRRAASVGTSTMRTVAPAVVRGPLEHSAEPGPVDRRIPLDEHELRRELVAVALGDQPVDEQLHAVERIAAVVVVPRGRDDAEVWLHVSRGSGFARHRRHHRNRVRSSCRPASSDACGRPRSTFQRCRTSTGASGFAGNHARAEVIGRDDREERLLGDAVYELPAGTLERHRDEI